MRHLLYDKLEQAEKKMIRATKAWIKLREKIRRLEKKLDAEFSNSTKEPPNAS